MSDWQRAQLDKAELDRFLTRGDDADEDGPEPEEDGEPEPSGYPEDDASPNPFFSAGGPFAPSAPKQCRNCGKWATHGDLCDPCLAEQTGQAKPAKTHNETPRDTASRLADEIEAKANALPEHTTELRGPDTAALARAVYFQYAEQLRDLAGRKSPRVTRASVGRIGREAQAAADDAHKRTWYVTRDACRAVARMIESVTWI